YVVLSGAASGLTGTLVLVCGDETIEVLSDGNFSCPEPLQVGSSYSISIDTVPTGQGCVITQASGEVTSGGVSGISVECISTPVKAFYPTNGSNWNDYVVND